MAATHIADPDLALGEFSSTQPDQDADTFKQLKERKTSFALLDSRANPDALAENTFRRKALFCSSLRSPAAEWYGKTIETATPWDDIKSSFITRLDFRMDGIKCVIEWK